MDNASINIVGDNIITTNERKNLMADALTTIGFDMEGEEITDETSKNLGNKIGGGLPIFADFLAKLYVTKKVLPVQGAQATSMINKAAQKLVKYKSPFVQNAIKVAASIPGQAF